MFFSPLLITFAQNFKLVADIAIYTLTSGLHDEQAVEAATKEFLNGLNVAFMFKGSDFADYGSHALELIYVRTGGTEGLFKQLLPELQRKKSRPIYLLTSGKSNSLAASMEILSFLRQQGLEGEIIHGDAAYISRRIMLLKQVVTAKQQLQACRLGIIGEPSDWLISSNTDADLVRQKTGIELVKIPMDELLMTISATPQREVSEKAPTEAIKQAYAYSMGTFLLPSRPGLGAAAVLKGPRDAWGCRATHPRDEYRYRQRTSSATSAPAGQYKHEAPEPQRPQSPHPPAENAQ